MVSWSCQLFLLLIGNALTSKHSRVGHLTVRTTCKESFPKMSHCGDNNFLKRIYDSSMILRATSSTNGGMDKGCGHLGKRLDSERNTTSRTRAHSENCDEHSKRIEEGNILGTRVARLELDLEDVVRLAEQQERHRQAELDSRREADRRKSHRRRKDREYEAYWEKQLWDTPVASGKPGVR